MKLVILLVSLCIISPRVFAEVPPDVFMRAHLLDAEGDVIDSLEAKVGQRVTLALDIYTATWFTRAPKLEPLSVAGAIALQAQGFGINYSERRHGVRYAVQRRELSIFPQRAGQFIVPSQVAMVGVAGDKGQTRDALKVRSEPLVFQVTDVTGTPEGDDRLQVLVANELIIEENFEPSLAQLAAGEKTLRAGDAIVRQVTYTAKGTLGMLIKPMAWSELEGVTQQTTRARVTDRTERGEFSGVRHETRSYVFERAGHYQLPAQDIVWWDAVSQRLVTSTLAAQEVTVLPSALGVSEQADTFEASPQPKDWLKGLAAILATVLVGYLVLVSIRVSMRFGRKYLQGYRSSQVYARRQLLHACRLGDKALIVRRFYRWQQRLPPSVLETPQAAELQAALTEFYQMYYRPADDSRAAGQRLAGSVQTVARQADRFKVTMPRGRALVDLNPR